MAPRRLLVLTDQILNSIQFRQPVVEVGAVLAVRRQLIMVQVVVQVAVADKLLRVELHLGGLATPLVLRLVRVITVELGNIILAQVELGEEEAVQGL